MNNPSCISEGTVVRGNVHADGDIEIHGQVEGSIEATGQVEIDDGAMLKCDIAAERVLVRGAVAGSIQATDSLVLEPGARVVGDLSAPNIGIRPGALVRGRVQTTGEGAAKPVQVSRAARGRAPSAKADEPSAATSRRRGTKTKGTRRASKRPPIPVIPKASGRAKKMSSKARRAGAPSPQTPSLKKRTKKVAKRRATR